MISQKGYPECLLRDLYPLIAALALAAILYAVREIHRRRVQVNPAMPDITMRETWELWRREHDQPLPEHIRTALETGLPALENLPRLALRQAILENAIAELHLTAIAAYGEAERQALLSGYTEGMDALLRDAAKAASLKCSVLRHYGRLKYDDAVPHDWFQHFQEVAQPYIGEKVRLARDYVFEMDEAAGRFVARYDALLEDLVQAMLKAPPKKRFVPPDLPKRSEPVE